MTDQARIWIVDDDEAIRFVLKRALTRAGYAVESFTTVASVRRALETRSPLVIITIFTCRMPMAWWSWVN